MGGAFGPAHCSVVGFTALRSFPRNRNAPKNTGSFLPFFSLLFRSSPPFFFSILESSPYPFACSSICPFFLAPRAFSCIPLLAPLSAPAPFSRPSIWLLFFISPLGGRIKRSPRSCYGSRPPSSGTCGRYPSDWLQPCTSGVRWNGRARRYALRCAARNSFW